MARLDVLVTSSDIEHRNALVEVLDSLSLNVIACNALSQAEEVLQRQTVDVIFCDDHLTDGSYRDLLPMYKRSGSAKTPRLVVTIRTGEWDEYLEAMRLGAFDALRRPWHPTDVEMVMLRALHEDRRAAERMIA